MGYVAFLRLSSSDRRSHHGPPLPLVTAGDFPRCALRGSRVRTLDRFGARRGTPFATLAELGSRSREQRGNRLWSSEELRQEDLDREETGEPGPLSEESPHARDQRDMKKTGIPNRMSRSRFRHRSSRAFRIAEGPNLARLENTPVSSPRANSRDPNSGPNRIICRRGSSCNDEEAHETGAIRMRPADGGEEDFIVLECGTPPYGPRNRRSVNVTRDPPSASASTRATGNRAKRCRGRDVRQRPGQRDGRGVASRVAKCSIGAAPGALYPARSLASNRGETRP